MKTLLSAFYRPSTQEFVELWEKALVVLDANALLYLYRYPKAARDELLKVLHQIDGRLWIPHQVALEYQVNRPGVIAHQQEQYEDVQKALREMVKKLRGDLDRLQLKKRHPVVDPDQFLKDIEAASNAVLDKLDPLARAEPYAGGDDKIRDEVDVLFDGRVGPPYGTQEELDKIYQEGEQRYKNNRPPGFMDVKKAERDNPRAVYHYEGLQIRQEYGDLIVWRQILAEAKRRQIKHLIFVVDDDKEDWWWVVGSEGRQKTIGPRPELVAEIATEAGVSLFYMYKTHRFLEYAKQYLKIRVKKESIEQVRQVQSSALTYPPPASWDVADTQLYPWPTSAAPMNMPMGGAVPWELATRQPTFDKHLIAEDFVRSGSLMFESDLAMFGFTADERRRLIEERMARLADWEAYMARQGFGPEERRRLINKTSVPRAIVEQALGPSSRRPRDRISDVQAPGVESGLESEGKEGESSATEQVRAKGRRASDEESES